MENEEKGITLGRIFKVAFHNWKLFTPVAVVVAVGCALGIQFGLNPYRGSYSSTFAYSSADLAEEKYADGSNFYYRNLISASNLSAIKASNEKYASIDVDKILDSNGISVSSDTEKKTYTITLGYKYVKDYSIAKSFIDDIEHSALVHDAALVEKSDYSNSLKLFDGADTFEQQVKYLAKQADFLTAAYDVIMNNAKLPTSAIGQASSNKEKVSLILGENFVENTDYTISTKGYVKSYDVQEAKNYEISKAQLQNEKTLNSNKISALNDEIAELKAAGASISELSEKIVDLTLRNADIDFEISAIDNKLANKGKDPSTIDGYTAFVENLANYRSKLATATDDYKTVIKAAYIDGASVTYDNSSVIVLNGTVNIVVNVVLSIVVGVVVGAVVNLIVDRKKLYE